MTTAAETKAKSDEELLNTFMLILSDGEVQPRVLDIKNVSGTYAKTKITTKSAETLEIAFNPSLKTGSLISTDKTGDQVTFTDQGGEKYDNQSPGGLFRVTVVQKGAHLAHEGNLENVRLQNAEGETVLLNGAFLAYLSDKSAAKKP